MNQETALEWLKSGHNCFITGEAGTGKSYIIKKFISYCNKEGKKIGVTSTTGITAEKIGGITINSFLKYGIFKTLNKQYFEEYRQVLKNTRPFNETKDFYEKETFKNGKYFNSSSLPLEYFGSLTMKMTEEGNEVPEVHQQQKYAELKPIIQELDVLIIDEISMMDSMTFTMIDYILRKFRGDARKKENSLINFPFGNVQIILSGDLCQFKPIQPIGKNNFRETNAYKLSEFKVLYLDKQYRQNDNDNFYKILRNIRSNNVEDQDIQTINNRNNLKDNNAIKLEPKNKEVDEYNKQKLDELNTQSQRFVASFSGDLEILKDNFKEIPKDLFFKVGARVISTINDNESPAKYSNGSLGTVVRLTTYDITVQFDNGNLVTIGPAKSRYNAWLFHAYETHEDAKTVLGKLTKLLEQEKSKPYYIDRPNPYIKEVGDNKWLLFQYEEIASISQIPLKLAWAITIHKSQGMTLDKATVNVNHLFGSNMGYVALSRLKSIDGLFLEGELSETKLNLDYQTLRIDAELQQDSKSLENIPIQKRFITLV